MTIRIVRIALPVLLCIILPSTTVAQDHPEADLQTAVTGLIIHSDVKTAFAEKAFEVALRRLCVLCDANPTYMASLMISMHKAVKGKGFDRKFIPVVMNYNRIVGTVDRIYAERGRAIERRTELCTTLAGKYITVRPETETAEAAASDIIDGYSAFLGKK